MARHVTRNVTRKGKKRNKSQNKRQIRGGFAITPVIINLSDNSIFLHNAITAPEPLLSAVPPLLSAVPPLLSAVPPLPPAVPPLPPAVSPLPPANLKSELEPLIQNIISNAYDLVYISIGAKYNEQSFTVNRKSISTNSPYQLIPYFLTNKPDKNILCISIDIYNDNNDINTTIRESTSKYDTSELRNINMYIINTINGRNEIMKQFGYEPQKQAEYVSNIIGAISNALKIEPKNYMVCNYVKFKHPNKDEETLKNALNTNIYQALNNAGYQDSYYNWCGYNKLAFYDFIQKETIEAFPIKLGNIDLNNRDGLTDIHTIHKPTEIRNIMKYYPIVNKIPFDILILYDIEPPTPNTNNFVYNMGELYAQMF